MLHFEDSEIVVQKALALKNATSLKVVFQKLSRLAEKLSLQLFEAEEILKNSKNAQDVSVNSKDLKLKQQKLILSLALKNRVKMLLVRNFERVEYFSEKLKASGIYEERFDKKTLIELEKKEINNVSAATLNINPEANGSTKMKFVFGECLLFENGKINFSNEHNREVLNKLSPEALTKIIENYPHAASTVAVDDLLNLKIKKNLLRAIASFVSEQLKSKSVKDVNNELGGLLSFKTEITRNASDYMAGVQNLFDVMTKNKLIQKHPEKAVEIGGKLKCNEHSELLPPSKIQAVLSDGLAGEVQKTEEQESEEVRINKEKEEQTRISNDLLFDNLLEMYEEMQQEQELDEKEERKKDDLKREQEERNEQAKEEQEIEELEAMLHSFSKHDSN